MTSPQNPFDYIHVHLSQNSDGSVSESLLAVADSLKGSLPPSGPAKQIVIDVLRRKVQDRRLLRKMVQIINSMGGLNYLYKGEPVLEVCTAPFINEGCETQGMVTRTSDQEQITVALESSNPQVLTVPANVVIPDRKRIALFDIDTIDDFGYHGDKIIDITAKSCGYQSGLRSIRLVDQGIPVLDPTLIGWWDATDESTITEVGGTITQWDDKSGNTRHLVQPIATKQPVHDSANGLMHFTGATPDGHHLRLSSIDEYPAGTFNSSFTVVVEMIAGSGNGTFISRSSGALNNGWGFRMDALNRVSGFTASGEGKNAAFSVHYAAAGLRQVAIIVDWENHTTRYIIDGVEYGYYSGKNQPEWENIHSELDIPANDSFGVGADFFHNSWASPTGFKIRSVKLFSRKLGLEELG